MHQRRNQLTIAAVTFILGLLVIVQLRTQASGSAFAGLSSQELTVDGVPLEDPFELRAIGAPDKLTGSLTRSGGIIAQLAATLPDVLVEVTPLERLDVPATERLLVPSH